MAVLELIPSDDERLRKKTSVVRKYDLHLAKLAQDLIDTLEKTDYIGLSAPQVGRSERIFVLRDSDNNFTVCVNPYVIFRTKKTVHYSEVCCSLPNNFKFKERAAGITIQYKDINGDLHLLTAIGILARQILHEIDHLDGYLMTD